MAGCCLLRALRIRRSICPQPAAPADLPTTTCPFLHNGSFPLVFYSFSNTCSFHQVLLAAGIVSKQNGKILISRQFVEMTRARIEGLLTAFSKLITKDKQHTFIETDSVRYVYQALMDRLYCVLITTKTSNILEDLETLRLFVRVIGEYTSHGSSNKSITDEQAVLDNAFTLIFAFDEIVALGYRESVNLSQVRTFIEMDSHEERVYNAVRLTQERDAKQKMRERSKELSKQQRTMSLNKSSGISSSSMSSASLAAITEIKGETYAERTPAVPTYVPSRPRGPSKALKLGSKSNNASFLPPEAEEQLVTELKRDEKPAGTQDSAPAKPIQIMMEERLKCELRRSDGALQVCELSGTVLVHVHDEAYVQSKIQIECEDENVVVKTHPKVDVDLFKQNQIIALKNNASFPLNSSVSVLKYTRSVTSVSDDWPPLIVTVWPNGSNCSIEVQANRSLEDVRISIPCPKQPVVNDCQDGEYEWNRGVLTWSFALLSQSPDSVAMDFDLDQAVDADHFFPVKATFTTKTNLAGIHVVAVNSSDEEGDSDSSWSLSTKFSIEKYEIS